MYVCVYIYVYAYTHIHIKKVDAKGRRVQQQVCMQSLPQTSASGTSRSQRGASHLIGH